MKRVKLYPEQAQVGAPTLLAEPQVERKEPRGNPRAKRDDCRSQNAAYRPAWISPYTFLDAPPSSRGLGHHPFKVKIAGSNPAGGTTSKC